MPTVDAHLHLWDLEHGTYSWLSDAVGPINRTFTWAEAEPQLRDAGVDLAVLVQAADTAEDTAAMMAVAADAGRGGPGAGRGGPGAGRGGPGAGRGGPGAGAGRGGPGVHEGSAAHERSGVRDGSADGVAATGAAPAVAGVVGWVDLLDPDRVPEELDRWAAAGPLVGLRHLIHDEPDPDWLGQEAVRRSLAVLASRDLAYDVIGVLPRHLEHAVAIADELPGLRLIVDHLGTPPVGTEVDGSAWSDLIGELARRPNVFLKLSGWTTLGPAGAATVADLRPSITRALDAFGPSRMLYGGDWPVSTLATTYAETFAGVGELLDGLSAAERADVLGGTAVRAYRLAG